LNNKPVAALAIWLTVVSLTAVMAPQPAAADLPDSIERALAGLGVAADDVSILVRRLDTPEPLLSHLPDEPRNPASVMKLVTTWSALELLGPAYTWPTEVYFHGDFDGQKLYGDLGIKGYGDPFLVLEEFWKLLRSVRRSGLSEIEGDLLLDTSHFDIPFEDPAAFDGQPYRTYNVVPNALLVNFKAVRFFFLADPRNRRVFVSSDPELPNLDIRNRIELVDGPCRGYQAGISFNIDDPEAMSRVIFEGQFPARCNNYGLSRTVLDHDNYVFGIFRSLWGELGGSLEGRLRQGPIPEDARLFLTWESPPLAEVIRSINKNSNNVMTRQLLLTLGAELRGVPGTERNGAEVIEEFLASRGINDGSLHIVNGAGLSRDSRVSARLLVDMLAAAARTAYAPEFMASLSIAGIDGTTRDRYDASSGNGVMHVKTGRLDHVSGLAGYAHGADDALYALAILMNSNDAHLGLGQELEEAVLRWLHTQI
jgi:D-alanyl-D-alanine carboxypeptidase/D-alanyl-D-alanine-endopeptidase (penicillin-binding protein 4)